MIVEAFDILNTIPEINRRQLCYYWVTDEPQEGGG